MFTTKEFVSATPTSIPEDNGPGLLGKLLPNKERREAAKKKANEEAQAKKEKTEAYVKSLTTGTDLERRKFINEVNPGVRLDEHGKTKEGIQREKFVFSQNLEAKYTKYLNDYLFNLHVLRRDQPAILNNALHTHENEIFQKILGDKYNDATAETQIKAFLNDPDHKEEHIMLVNQLMTEEMQRKMAALQATLSINPPGERQWELPDKLKIRTGVDQGSINKLWNDVLEPAFKAEYTSGGRSDPPFGYKALKEKWKAIAAPFVAAGLSYPLGEIAALVAANPVLIGAVPLGVGAATAGAELFLGSVRSGLTFNADKDNDVFQTIASSQQEREYVKAMYGINIVSDGAGGWQVDKRTTIAPNQIFRDVLSTAYARFQFNAELFKDQPQILSQIDAFRNQWLVDESDIPEQDRTRDNIWIQNRLQELAPDLAAISKTEAIQFEAQARREYMNKLLSEERVAKKLLEQEKKENEMADKLEGLLIARTDPNGNGEIQKRLILEIDERLKPLQANQAVFTEERDLFNKILDINEDVDNAVKNLEDKKTELNMGGMSDEKVIDALHVYTTRDVANVMGGAVLRIDGHDVGPNSLDHEINKIIDDIELSQLPTAQTTLNSKESVLTTATTELKTAQNALQTNDDQIKDINQIILGYQQTLTASPITMSSTGVPTIRPLDPATETAIAGAISKAEADRETLRLARGGIEGTIATKQSAENLARRERDEAAEKVAELKNRLKTIREHPEQDRDTKRWERIRPRIEQQTTVINDLITAKKTAEKALEEKKKTDVDLKRADALSKEYRDQYRLFMLTFGISRSDLINKDVDELLVLVNAHNTTHPTEGWPSTQNLSSERRKQVLHAKLEANARLVATASGSPSIEDKHRKEALDNIHASNAAEMMSIEGEKTNIPNKLKDEVQLLQNAKDLNDRRVKAFTDNEKSYDFADKVRSSNLPALQAVVPLTNDRDIPGSSDAEHKTITINGTAIDFSTVPSIYFQILKLVTDHTPETFERWATQYPPDRLLNMVMDNAPRTTGLRPTNMSELAITIKHNVDTHVWNASVIQDTIRKIIRKDVNAASKLPAI